MLKYIEIDYNNLDYATSVQMKIFPEKSVYEHYKYTIKNNLDYILQKEMIFQLNLFILK